MSKYWSALAQRLDPYVPGEQPKDKAYIKLNTNENPYPPSPNVLAAITRAANQDLRLYPDPTCDELRECIARYHGLQKEQIFVGNGSDELLAFVFLAFFNPGAPILFPDITYSFYPVYAGLFGIDYKVIPLADDFSLPGGAFQQENGGIIFPNPNAPTGRALPLAAVEEIVSNNSQRVVVVDEAYIDFGGTTAICLANKYPNLLVVQTLSKSRSLAGLRVGFAVGNDELIQGLDRVKNSFNSYPVDRLALAGAVAAFQDDGYFQDCRQKVIASRARTVLALERIGFAVVPSQANFIFISHPQVGAAELYARLREEGVLVRYFNKPRISNFLRVTIGTDVEMDCFVEKITAIVSKRR